VKISRLSFLVFLGFVLLAVNLARMQLWKGDYYRLLSERNRVRVIYLEGPRGKILDRNNEILASNRLSFNCSVISREAKAHMAQSCQVVGPILGIPARELEARFRKKKPGMFQTVLLAEDIGASEAMAIEEKLDLLPGFMIETRPLRQYPLGESAAHLTGFIGPMTEGEVDVLEFYGYRPVDWLGKDGVEKTYEAYLRGRSGGVQMEVDSRGRFVRALGFKEPKEGKDIQLTVDSRLQTFVQNLLESRKGAVLVMELDNGGLLSVNSSPSFDPNLFASTQGRKKVGKYLHHPQSPMVDRGIRGQYPPGSIFKIVTALAALGRHKIDGQTSVDCPGHSMIGGKTFRCWKEAGHGSQRLTQALAHSCNVYFYSVGLLTGMEALFETALEFGFSRLVGIDLPGERPGFVPSRDWKRKALGQGWYDGETANLSIGQGYLEVTPLQALVMISAVATQGQLLKPHVIDKIEGVKAAQKHTRAMDVSALNWKLVSEGLDQVINSPTGTGRLSVVEGLKIAGKTGTAQSGQNKTHAWFVGFAPKEKPTVALVVFLEHGGRGGVNAAALAGKIFGWLKGAGY
jgi:penicillin-binding protein 2